MQWKCSKKRRQKLAWYVLGVFSLITAYVVFGPRLDITQTVLAISRIPPENRLLQQQITAWKSLHKLILDHNPRCDKRPELIVPHQVDIGYDPDRDRARPDVLWLDPSDIKRLQNAHSNFIQDLHRLPADLLYQPGTHGIVMSAPESMLSTLSISLRMLRKTGTNLPVEVFVPASTRYTRRFCDSVLLSLGAKCLFLDDIFLRAKTTIALSSSQYRLFAVFFSSFENILLLGSDVWPVVNPEYLFYNHPFTESGMVLWPDFWYPSESPYYFEIAKIRTPLPLNARPATEAGEMNFSKSKHNSSLLLAAYYNFYGPEYYFPLLSQGGPGEDDKEIFLSAATALSKDYWFVDHPVTSLGRHDQNGEWIGSAMVQYDPVQDYLHTQIDGRHVNDRIIQSEQRPDGGKYKSTAPETKPAPAPAPDMTLSKRPDSVSKPMFIHTVPEHFDIDAIFQDQQGNESSIPVKQRSWMCREDAVRTFGFDIEHRFWQAIVQQRCSPSPGHYQHKFDSRINRDQERQNRAQDQQVCEMVKQHIAGIF